MSTSTTITDVLGYIATKATLDEVGVIFEAAKGRDRSVRKAVAAKVSIGAQVKLHGLSPKLLNGLVGTVRAIHGSCANVDLDATSKLLLEAVDQSHKFHLYYDGDTPYAMRVPLSCCVVQGDA